MLPREYWQRWAVRKWVLVVVLAEFFTASASSSETASLDLAIDLIAAGVEYKDQDEEKRHRRHLRAELPEAKQRELVKARARDAIARGKQDAVSSPPDS